MVPFGADGILLSHGRGDFFAPFDSFSSSVHFFTIPCLAPSAFAALAVLVVVRDTVAGGRACVVPESFEEELGGVRDEEGPRGPILRGRR